MFTKNSSPALMLLLISFSYPKAGVGFSIVSGEVSSGTGILLTSSLIKSQGNITNGQIMN